MLHLRHIITVTSHYYCNVTLLHRSRLEDEVPVIEVRLGLHVTVLHLRHIIAVT